MSLFATLRRAFGSREPAPLDVERLGLNTWLQTAEFITNPGHQIPWLKWCPQLGVGLFARALPLGIEYPICEEWKTALRYFTIGRWTDFPAGKYAKIEDASDW